MAEMEPQDDSLTNNELAAKVETMERTCELLDEQLAAMRAAESALFSFVLKLLLRVDPDCGIGELRLMSFDVPYICIFLAACPCICI